MEVVDLWSTPSVPYYLSIFIGTQILRNLWGICKNAQFGSNQGLGQLSNELFCIQNWVVNKKRYDGLKRLRYSFHIQFLNFCIFGYLAATIRYLWHFVVKPNFYSLIGWLKITCEPNLSSKAFLQILLLFRYLAKFYHKKRLDATIFVTPILLFILPVTQSKYSGVIEIMSPPSFE
jgi:hypothetical protein